MDIDEVALKITSEVDKSLSGIKKATNNLNSLSNASLKVAKSFDNASKSIQPTVNKLNDLSSKASEAGKKINSSLNIKPTMSISDYESKLNKLKEKQKLYSDNVRDFQEGLDKNSARTAINPDLARQSEISGLEKYKNLLKETESEITKTESIIKRMYNEMDSGFMKIVHDYESEHPTISIDTRKALESLTNVTQATEKLKELSNINITAGMSGKEISNIVGLRKALENILGVRNEINNKPIQPKVEDKPVKNTNKNFKDLLKTLNKLPTPLRILKNLTDKVGNAFSIFYKHSDKSLSQLVTKFKKLGLGLLSIRTTMALLTNAVSSYLAFDSDLQDSITNSWNILGSLLAPVIELVAKWFYIATDYVYNFIKALTGIDLVARANAKGLNAQAKATKAAGQAQRSLSSMDEITNLQTPSGSGGGGDGFKPIVAEDIDADGIFSKLIEAIKAGDWYGVGSIIADGINKALGSIPWDKIKTGATKAGLALANIFNGIVDNLNWNLLGTTIGNGIQTAINFAYAFVTTFHWGVFGKGLADSLMSMFNSIDWEMAGKTIHDGLMGILTTIDTFIQNIDWGDLGKKIGTFVDNIDLSDLAMRLFNAIMDALSGFEELLNNAIGKPWTNVLEGLVAAIYTVKLLSTIGTVIDKFKKFGETLSWLTESKFFASFIKSLNGVTGALLNGIRAIVKYIAQLAIMAAKTAISVAQLIAQKAATVAMTVAQGALNLVINANPMIKIVMVIAAVIAGLVLLYNKCEWFRDLVDGIFSFISGLFTKAIDFFKNNWQGILLFLVNPFAGAFKLIYDNCEGFREIVDTTIGAIKDFVSNMIDGIKEKIGTIKDWFGEVFTKAFDNVKNAFGKVVSFFTGIKDNIVNIFRTIGTSVGNVISGAFKGVVNGVLGAIERILNTPIRAINGLIKVINKVPGVSLGTLNEMHLPRLATGTNDIEKEGIYHLHEGEAVVPKKYNPATGGYNDGSDNKQIIDLLVSLNSTMLEYAERPMNVYMDAKKVAEATYDNLQQVGKNKNVSSVMTRS